VKTQTWLAFNTHRLGGHETRAEFVPKRMIIQQVRRVCAVLARAVGRREQAGVRLHHRSAESSSSSSLTTPPRVCLRAPLSHTQSDDPRVMQCTSRCNATQAHHWHHEQRRKQRGCVLHADQATCHTPNRLDCHALERQPCPTCIHACACHGSESPFPLGYSNDGGDTTRADTHHHVDIQKATLGHLERNPNLGAHLRTARGGERG
jgi:hypothetical protein